MTTTPAIDPMASLREEHQALANLVELMKVEQAFLVAADINGLQSITEKKAKVVAQVSELAQQRHHALAMAGFAPEEQNMQAWLASINQDNVSAAWQQLLAITKAAKELNRVNGILVNKQLSYNQNALNTLQAPIHAETGGNFYGPNGQSTPYSTSRRVVVG